MSVKIFNKETNQWVIFPGTIGAPGKDAYIIAQENGYQGTKEEYNQALVDIPTVTEKITDLEGKIEKQVTSNDVFTTQDKVIVAEGNNRGVKDSGILISNLALKSELSEIQVSWDRVTDKPETYAPSEHKHNVADIDDFPEIPEPIQIDSELSASSENPVQNKVINSAIESINNNLGNKLEASVLDNYYTKSQVDDKIEEAGEGDVVVSGNLVDNNIVLGAGNKSVKDSGVALNSLATQQWVTEKNYLSNNDPEYPGNSATATKVQNKLIFTGAVTGEYDGSLEVTVDIPKEEIPIALPNPYPLTINAKADIPNGAVIDNICKYSGESEVTANINVAGYDECSYETGEPYLLKINGKTEYVLNGSGKWGVPHLGTAITPGNYGICDKSAESESITITDSNLSKDKQVAILVTKGNINVTFNNAKFKLTDNINNIQGSSSQYKCYCFQYINDNLILVNCSIYA